MKLRIEKIVAGGDGLGILNGKIFFVPFSAPGDLLEIAIDEDHEHYAHAHIERILEPSPDRVTPLCPVFGLCGGCSFQHLSYQAQLKWKREIVIESFVRIGKMPRELLESLVPPTLPSPQEWHYRNRIQLHVDRQGRVGFYKEQSHTVVEFDRCFIADDSLNQQLHQQRDTLSKSRKGMALKVHAHDYSFSQVNDLQNTVLQNLVVEWLQTVPHAVVVELYAGAGNFTFPIATLADQVVAIEIDKRAVAHARNRQAKERLQHIVFHGTSAHNLVSVCTGRCDAVVLDPPRQGAPDVLEAIVQLRPTSVMYISCDPVTLARDLQKLQQHGWKLKRLQPLDMFPQTAHVETISLLTAESG